jgi:spermidine synthase
MNSLVNGYFTETNPLSPGQAFSLQVEKVLWEGNSQFQHLIVFDSTKHGRVLVLDGAIQLTEYDECSYQEMIAHIPLLSHANPKKVCVIGGGDGAVLKQILKHKTVEEVHLCEIDELVINKTKEYFPQFAPVWDHPKLKLVVNDGVKYLAQYEGEFDVIIVDSSDPIGPANVLFESNFYKIANKALRTGGIVCSQAENVWAHLDLIKGMVDFSKNIFPSVWYTSISVPTYPSGSIGFLICTKTADGKRMSTTPLRTPQEALNEGDVETLKYYHPALHTAAFVLPRFATFLNE